jgi:mono/diheme cytochrome c family protein
MMIGATVLLLAGALAGVVLLLSGAMTTAATAQHFRLTYRLLDWGLHLSVSNHAAGISAPDLSGSRRLGQGYSCYQSHCQQCHGLPGLGPEAFAQGLLPTPGNLAQAGRDWSAERLYYVTRKGIRMTGMPAWEYRLSDDSVWSTVAFVKQMPFMDLDRLAELDSVGSTFRCAVAGELTNFEGREPGPVVLRQYACDGCHLIEGLVGPITHVGPPLNRWSRRKYIAGVVPNTRDNLVQWIRNPAAVSPGTLMPTLGVSEVHALAMADYLMSLD